MGRWLREPLVHFIVLGALLFSVDHWLVSRPTIRNTIVMGAEVDEEARRVFKAARGVEPDAVQLAALRKVWLDNEVLYREGLALQVDKGDTGIRDRVIFKALNIIGANLQRPDFDDKTLRDWFESRREKYDEPARFDFEEAVLSDDNTEAAARAFAAALNAGTPGDAKAGLACVQRSAQVQCVAKLRPRIHSGTGNVAGGRMARSPDQRRLARGAAHGVDSRKTGHL